MMAMTTSNSMSVKPGSFCTRRNASSELAIEFLMGLKVDELNVHVRPNDIFLAGGRWRNRRVGGGCEIFKAGRAPLVAEDPPNQAAVDVCQIGFVVLLRNRLRGRLDLRGRLGRGLSCGGGLGSLLISLFSASGRPQGENESQNRGERRYDPSMPHETLSVVQVCWWPRDLTESTLNQLGWLVMSIKLWTMTCASTLAHEYHRLSGDFLEDFFEGFPPRKRHFFRGKFPFFLWDWPPAATEDGWRKQVKSLLFQRS